ncbi:MAG: hypothetical protein FJ128_07970 [Deltaproteobacteria bacterium]|nr:hypothetical protein [Deltaproteobacteria bacterium]
MTHVLQWKGLAMLLALTAALLLAAPAGAQVGLGDSLTKAIAALKSEKPSAGDKQALDKLFADHAEAVFKKAGVKPSKEDLERFQGNTVLTLQILAVMTGGDEATLKKITMDDLVAVSFVLMAKMKELKATAKELNDEKWRNEKLIPAVIQELAKGGREQEGAKGEKPDTKKK